MARVKLSAVAERPVVAMCAGKDCRKRCEFAKVRGALEAHCDVLEMECVGLCNGPVVVVDPDGPKPAVYSKLRSKQHRKLIVAVAEGNPRARRELSGRRVTKQKVATKVSRQTKRRLVTASRAA